MEVSPYQLSKQEAALKVPTDQDIVETVKAVNGGIDKLQAENQRLRTALEKLADSVDAYFDEMGVPLDDTPLAREVAEARKAL